MEWKKYLLDFCPASNTLGWRWVAGLHSINKPYLAMSGNINYFTNGKFNPIGQLNEKAKCNYIEQNSMQLIILHLIQHIHIHFQVLFIICRMD